MRIGLAGAGRIGCMHAGILAGLPSVESVIVADRHPARAEALAGRIGGKSVETLSDLLATGVDGLVVAASTGAHAEILLAAAEAGLPTFCEKPVALEVATTEAVVRKLEDVGAVVQMGFQRRFDPGYAALRRAVRSGELGWLHSVRAVAADPSPPPAEFVATSGGLFRDCVVHDADAIRWVTGQEVVSVYAAGANQGADFFAASGDVDTGAALFVLEGGTLASVSVSRYNGHGYDARLEVAGSVATMVAGLSDRSSLAPADEGVPWPGGSPHVDFMDRFAEAYRAELVAFTEVVAGLRPSPCLPADALAAAYVVEACEASRREGRMVVVEACS
ncbi:MAG: Gfo/Idh/MocA family protein [Acidimicrobiales bacterium]